MKPCRRDRKGQSAVIDALLFFFIMIVASLFLNHTSFAEVEKININGKEIEYSQNVFDALMKCTVNTTNYTKIIGEKKVDVELIHKNVLELLLEDLSLRERAGGVDNNSLERGMERAISDILTNLTSYTFSNHSQIRLFNFYLLGETKYLDELITVEIGDIMEENEGNDKIVLPLEKYSIQQSWDMPDGTGVARITLFLWRE